MANKKHFLKLKEGVGAWNQWRKENPGLEPDLQSVNLSDAQLQNADLSRTQLQRAFLARAQLQGANLPYAQLQGAQLFEAQLQGAHLYSAQLQGAYLNGAQLQGASLYSAELQGANLREAQLQGANLSRANLEETTLDGITLVDNYHVGPQVADIRWGETNLAVVDWSQLKILGDEYKVHRPTTSSMAMKSKATDLEDYRTAVRANRQLAVVLRDQGLNEDADRFAYRAQVLQWRVFWEQKNSGVGFFLGFLLWWRVMVTGWSAFSLHMP